MPWVVSVLCYVILFLVCSPVFGLPPIFVEVRAKVFFFFFFADHLSYVQLSRQEDGVSFMNPSIQSYSCMRTYPPPHPTPPPKHAHTGYLASAITTAAPVFQAHSFPVARCGRLKESRDPRSGMYRAWFCRVPGGTEWVSGQVLILSCTLWILSFCYHMILLSLYWASYLMILLSLSSPLYSQ